MHVDEVTSGATHSTSSCGKSGSNSPDRSSQGGIPCTHSTHTWSFCFRGSMCWLTLGPVASYRPTRFWGNTLFCDTLGTNRFNQWNEGGKNYLRNLLFAPWVGAFACLCMIKKSAIINFLTAYYCNTIYSAVFNYAIEFWQALFLHLSKFTSSIPLSFMLFFLLMDYKWKALLSNVALIWLSFPSSRHLFHES